jgi:AmiR/NasT family two-component response regulator
MSIYYTFFNVDITLVPVIMDTQQEIERAAGTLAKEKSCSIIEALNMLRSKYQSDRRLEEAQIVSRLIDKELQKAEKEGFYEES